MILPSETTVSHRYYQCTVVFYGYVMVCLFICICIHTHIYILYIYIILYILYIYIYIRIKLCILEGLSFMRRGFQPTTELGFRSDQITGCWWLRHTFAVFAGAPGASGDPTHLYADTLEISDNLDFVGPGVLLSINPVSGFKCRRKRLLVYTNMGC